MSYSDVNCLFARAAIVGKSLISHAFSIFSLDEKQTKKTKTRKKQISEAINCKYFQINEAHAFKIYDWGDMNVYTMLKLVVHDEGNMRKRAQKHQP